MLELVNFLYTICSKFKYQLYNIIHEFTKQMYLENHLVHII